MRKWANYTILAALCLTASVSGCGKKPVPEETTVTEAAVEEEEAAEEVEAEPITEEELLLKQDYYEYVNGDFLTDIEIPPDSNNWSYFYELDQAAYETLNDILQQTVENRDQHAPGSSEQKITDLYLSSADLEAREETGLGELAGYLERIQGAQSIQEYADTLFFISREISYSSSFQVFAAVDMKDSSRYAHYMGIPDLGPGKETFEDASQSAVLVDYVDYISSVLTEAERTDGKAEAEEILAFQKDLASLALPVNDSWNPAMVYHMMTTEEIAALLPNINLEQALAAGTWTEVERLIVMEPEVIKKLNEYLTEEHLPLLKNYSTFCLLNDLAEYLPVKIRDAKADYLNKRAGIQEKKTEEKLSSEMVQNIFAFEFGKLYVETCFEEEDKTAVLEMVEQIIGEYGVMIDRLDWLGEETKASAKKKLEHMSIKVGYPDVWPNYLESADILPLEEGGSLVHNALEIFRAMSEETWSRAEKPVDREMWQMTPQTVNAYYSPASNEIVFPAAILQAPFYSRDSEYAENLGGIGTVIAHEITHAFDDNGSQFDENGNYQVWWSDADYDMFAQRSQAVVSYYGKYEALEGFYVNGEQTLGENIADLGAMSSITAIIGENPEQLRQFCTRYAQIWSSKYTDESMQMRLNTDVHSPAKVRVNAALSSTDAFYLAYPELKEGDAMYVEPEKRVKVW